MLGLQYIILTNVMDFWNLLYIECRKKNISPNKLAENLKLSNATMSRYKKGSLPSSETLILLADYFDVSTDYLLGRSEIDPDLPEDEKILLSNYRKSTEEGKNIIQATAESAAGSGSGKNLEETA